MCGRTREGNRVDSIFDSDILTSSMAGCGLLAGSEGERGHEGLLTVERNIFCVYPWLAFLWLILGHLQVLVFDLYVLRAVSQPKLRFVEPQPTEILPPTPVVHP